MISNSNTMLDLTDRTIKTILAIGKAKNMHKLCKVTNTTYSHQVKLIIKLEKLGFITTLLKGRDRNIFLTDKGKKLKWHLEQINLL